MAKKHDFQVYDESESGMNTPHFLIQSDKTQSGYGTITIRPVWLKGNQIRFYSHVNIFKNFQISCQWNLYHHEDPSYNHPYAFHVQYSDGIDLNQIEENEEKIIFLKKLNKGLAKLSEKFGSAESFEDFICRIAAVLGIENFVTMSDGHDYSDNLGKFFNAQDAKRHINRLYAK